MTTATTSAPEHVPAQAPPRKRRRKTASGAHEDCFACRRKGSACDRKRPYCTPCIEIGKECPGYKTTLTWNVGVASRGKLRGLSCPVTIKNPDGSDAIPTPEDVRRRRSSSNSNNASSKPSTLNKPANNSNRTSVRSSKIKIEEAFEPDATSSASYQPTFTGPTSAPTHTYQPSLPTIHAGQEGWHIPGFQASCLPIPQRPGMLRHPSLQMIQTALGSHHDSHGYPHSASSVGSYPETEFHSPLEYPQTPGSVTYNDAFPPTSNPFTSHSVGSSVDSYLDTLSSSVDSLGSAFSYTDESVVDPSLPDLSMYHPGSLGNDDFLFSPGLDMGMTANAFDQLGELQSQPEEEDPPLEQTEQKTMTLLEPRFSSPFFHVTPRLQSLMEYYDRHICPFLVAFDGPENPYRRYILQLATQNEGLQNAVAALATNNLRMRKSQPSKQLGFVEEITNAFDGSTKLNNSEPTAEETCYKQMSIDQLNMQLTENRAAQDDGVLATLLILCLFHVCDSGFSKFKTQLAGVQKLLSLRHPSGQSEFTRWVEMFFIWFDVMTSAVNDREMQIKGESLDMLDYSANLGALEQFSGCDGRLFKLIARLGRLNLLAQGRPVRPQERPNPPTPISPLKRKYTQHRPMMQRKRSQPRSLVAADYEHLDGNGWGNAIASSDDETDYFSDNNTSPRHTSHTSHTSNPTVDDRSDFWSEYHTLHNLLESWTPEPNPTDPDLLHINSAFRSSALLYTARLAHPILPSAHPLFQSHVSTALHHITSLAPTSCVNKFLLWPLFIIGTECVHESDRNTIRSRCWEVARESGFYNNLSSLEVLEKVWSEVGRSGDVQGEIRARRRDSEAGTTGRYGQAFRWRKAMHRVDGEYIVI